ncbi:hypothetical protein BKA81DRAFT_359479 [Phyllosticta paracitricarpa]|uniref:Secreted protein n=1 Tax=Phyllosticta citricarpa TaxID=55181 RepID=A0ABR1M629_9PEZI
MGRMLGSGSGGGGLDRVVSATDLELVPSLVLMSLLLVVSSSLASSVGASHSSTALGVSLLTDGELSGTGVSYATEGVPCNP